MTQKQSATPRDKPRCPNASDWCAPSLRRTISSECLYPGKLSCVCPKDETMLGYAQNFLDKKEAEVTEKYDRYVSSGRPRGGIASLTQEEIGERIVRATRDYRLAENLLSPKLDELKSAIDRKSDDNTLKRIISEIRLLEVRIAEMSKE